MKEARFAVAYIIQEGKILLVQEAHKEAYGLWSFPLGHVEENENEKEGAIREVKEETGYNIKLGNKKELRLNGKDFRSLDKFNDYLISLTVFEGKINSGILKIGDDVLDVKWFSLDEINNLPLRGDWLISFL